MIYKYQDFQLEKDVQDFITLFQKINESNELENLLNSVGSYLEEVYEKGVDYLYKFSKRVFKFFSNRTSIIVFLAFMLITRCGVQLNTLDYLLSDNVNKIEVINQAKNKYEQEKKNLDDFMEALAQRESSGDPTSINRSGYIGKYQFGRLALKEVGLDKKVKPHTFKENPEIWPEHEQDKAMAELIKKNAKYLGDYLDKYEGKTVAGIKISQSGLLAGAHLLGPTNVKKFINSNGKFIPKDGFGTPITEYISKFANYDLSSVIRG